MLALKIIIIIIIYYLLPFKTKIKIKNKRKVKNGNPLTSLKKKLKKKRLLAIWLVGGETIIPSRY